MSESIPIILCGQRESVGSKVIAGLQPDYEVIQFILTREGCIAEIPLILRGQKPDTSTSSIGTGDVTRRPVAVVLGGGYAPTFDEIHDEIEKMFESEGGSGVIWLRHDGEKPAPVPGTPEYGKAMVERVREQMRNLKDEGKLSTGVSEIRLY